MRDSDKQHVSGLGRMEAFEFGFAALLPILLLGAQFGLR